MSTTGPRTRLHLKYENLGKQILLALGTERSQRWLAEQTYVSPEAVSAWVKGKGRPQPDRLGHISALLRRDPEYFAELAQYDDLPALEKVLRSHEQWCRLYQSQSSAEATRTGAEST